MQQDGKHLQYEKNKEKWGADWQKYMQMTIDMLNHIDDHLPQAFALSIRPDDYFSDKIQVVKLWRERERERELRC